MNDDGIIKEFGGFLIWRKAMEVVTKQDVHYLKLVDGAEFRLDEKFDDDVDFLAGAVELGEEVKRRAIKTAGLVDYLTQRGMLGVARGDRFSIKDRKRLGKWTEEVLDFNDMWFDKLWESEECI